MYIYIIYTYIVYIHIYLYVYNQASPKLQRISGRGDLTRNLYPFYCTIPLIKSADSRPSYKNFQASFRDLMFYVQITAISLVNLEINDNIDESAAKITVNKIK